MDRRHHNMCFNHVCKGICWYSTDSPDFAYPWKAFCALWSNIWRADKNPSVASKQLRGLTLSKRVFYFPTVSTSCVYFIELFSSHSGARKCISKLINTGQACVEHVASLFRDTCERVWGPWWGAQKSLFLIFSELFIFFFLLQHHMRGLGKLMNYPHRGKTVCVSCTIPRFITWSCLNLLNWGLNFPTLICPNSLYTVTFLYKQDDSMKKYLYKSETLLNLTRVVRSALLTVLFYKKLGMYLQQFLWSNQVCVCVCAYWIPLGS